MVGDYSMVGLLSVHWSRLVNSVFSDDFSCQFGCRHGDVVFSLCRLCSRLIKLCQSAADVNSSIVNSTLRLLVNQLRCCRLPSLCRAKCLSVLIRTVHLDPVCPATVPPWTLNAAELVLREFHDVQPSCSWSMQCCLSTSIDHTGLATSHRGDSSTCSLLTDVAAETERQTDVSSSHVDCTSVAVLPSVSRRHDDDDDDDDDERVVCDVYDAELMRKMLLLLLRSLDVISRQAVDERE